MSSLSLIDHYYRLNSAGDPLQSELNTVLGEIHSTNLRIRELRGTFQFGLGRVRKKTGGTVSYLKSAGERSDADLALSHQAKTKSVSKGRHASSPTVKREKLPTLVHDRLLAAYEAGLQERKIEERIYFDPDSDDEWTVAKEKARDARKNLLAKADEENVDASNM